MLTTQWYEPQPDGRILCTLCPRACRLQDGDRGFCFVRKNESGQMVLDTYGKSTGFCIDPIEKKPLNHFLPGTPVLSFGTAGCNLGCKFCQNWDISKSREVARLSNFAGPADIANAACEHQCRSVAFTYNDPVIWAEYAIDTARECRARNIKTVAVTAGYITPKARSTFFEHFDAANIDLKAFSEDFYYRITSSHLQPVLDTIEYACNETNCWVELTNLLIPDANDAPDELTRMCDWILNRIGPNIPLHFTAFHPDFRMTDRGRTPHETLLQAYEIAKSAGLHYVYVGNVHDVAHQSTYCHACGELLIERDWYVLGRYNLNRDKCPKCDAAIPGVFEKQPGTWGAKRLPIVIRSNARIQPMQQAPLGMNFCEEELKTIHQAASELVAAAVLQHPSSSGIQLLGKLADRQVSGTYVTLKRGETLRGCCGWTGGEMSLDQSLADASYRTAKKDPRMPPIAPEELPFLQLSVSLLGPCLPLSEAQKLTPESSIQIGLHGLRIRHGNQAGLLLPSVAVEHGMDARQFLDALCRKAGLPPGAWLHASSIVERFDGLVVTDKIALGHLQIQINTRPTPAIATLLKPWVATNLRVFQTGATPHYYVPDVSDGDVLGVGIQVERANGLAPLSVFRLSILQSMPMQASLFELTQQIAHLLAAEQIDAPKVSVAVFTSAIHHGNLMQHELEGIDSQHRSLLVTDGKAWSMGYRRDASLSELLSMVRDKERIRHASAQVYSFACDCSGPAFFASTAPRPKSDMMVREPAAAGTFYPAELDQCDAVVDSLLTDPPKSSFGKPNAIMVPHAGLRFSGRVAAKVWASIEIPEHILIIGPKHTADGADWAIAPVPQWNLVGGASIQGDPSFAKQLSQSVPEFQLDAEAHRREHGIEVQLPILRRLAPNTRVSAIAMHGGDVLELRNAANKLAKLLRAMSKPPMLVISSDMNHFAEEAENRRRDRIALDAMRTLDPERLLLTCESNSISMCGLRPAVLAMMTLQELGAAMTFTEVDYSTSADITGDRSRVVGYAGVLL